MSKLFYDYFMREGADFNREYIIFNIIVDDGSETIALYNYFPNAHIYAFEGDVAMAAACAANLAPYSDRITFTPTATTNYDGTMTINGNDVACARLDTFIQNNSIPHVDFLLINHKTGVLKALEGLGDYLQYVQYLYSLITYYEVFTGQVIECNNYLLERNFRNMDVFPFHDWFDNATYANNRFDIVSAVRGKSVDYIDDFVQKTLTNVADIRFLHLIVPDASAADISALIPSRPNCRIVLESEFPFSLQTVESYSSIQESSSTLLNEIYYRQLLHLCAWRTIRGITTRHLLLDADTVFESPISMVKGGIIMCDYKEAVVDSRIFDHMSALDPYFRRVDEKSGDVGYGMMETRNLISIVGMTELRHKEAFYVTYLSNIPSFTDKTASEYELYFHFLRNSGYFNYELRQK